MDEEAIRQEEFSKLKSKANPQYPLNRRQDLEQFMVDSYSRIGKFLGMEASIPRFLVVERYILTEGMLFADSKIDPYDISSRFVAISIESDPNDQLFTASHEAGHLYHNFATRIFEPATRKQRLDWEKFAERYAMLNFKLLGKNYPSSDIISLCREDYPKSADELKSMLLEGLSMNGSAPK